MTKCDFRNRNRTISLQMLPAAVAAVKAQTQTHSGSKTHVILLPRQIQRS